MKLLVLVFVLGFTARISPAAEKYALVIGITGYPNFPANERLRFASADAVGIKEFLRTPEAGLFDEDNIRLLVDQNATRDAIYREIKWLSDRVNRDDVFYLFFAGHGVVDGGTGRAYFMPYDSSPEYPAGNGLRADVFVEDLREAINTRRAIFFVDACYAASASTPGARRNSESVSEELRELWEKEFSGKQELYMAFFSAASNQASFEDADLKHGLFTWYLLEGLRGKADRNGDRTVTAGELRRRFLVDAVEERAQSRFKREQTPTVSPVFEPSIALAIHGATGSIAEVVTPSSPPPPPPVKQEPTAKRKTAPSLFNKEVLASLSFQASHAPRPSSGNEKRYNFSVSMSGPSDVINRIGSAKFYFDYAKNPLDISGRRVGNQFVAEYEGWGCYSAVRVTLTAINREVTTLQVDMCSLLTGF